MTEIKTGYDLYNKKAKRLTKINPLDEFFPKLPSKKYNVIYADPPWDYGGKLQYDKSSIGQENINLDKNIFISSASFKYPTVKLKDLKLLDIDSIAADDCLLYMWTTGPQLQNSIELGNSWGFQYTTIAFVWDKVKRNPGHYTMSQTEMVLLFKKGKIPNPRGARNIHQFLSEERGKHSAKPHEIRDRIHEMFPEQEKIELFARSLDDKWDGWGLEAPNKKEV